VRGGIRHVDDVHPRELLLGSDLCGVDHRRRFDDVDNFADFLLVGERHIDVRRGLWLHVWQHRRVKALLLDPKLISFRSQINEDTASGKIGFAAQRVGFRGKSQLYKCGGNCDSVFVGYGDFESNRRTRGLRRMHLGGREALNQHENPEAPKESQYPPGVGH
jgi:hypothetical protein